MRDLRNEDRKQEGENITATIIVLDYLKRWRRMSEIHINGGIKEEILM